MALTSAQRIAAETLKTQYQQILRMLEQRNNSSVARLIARIKNECGKPATLIAEYYFIDEGMKQPRHDPGFDDFNSRLHSALYKCGGIAEYDNWNFRYSQFQMLRSDFRMYPLLVTDSTAIKLLEAANSAVRSGAVQKTFEVTYNDRRFLRGLHIAAD